MRRALVFLIILTSSIALAGMDEARRAMDRRDYATAFEAFKELADRGNAEAQFNIGLMYFRGEGVDKDYVKAVVCCQKAAKHGYAGAQLCLGISYLEGLGVQKDQAKGLIWVHKAADQGDILAQGELGDIFSNGEKVPRDLIRAYMWYDLAAGGDVASAAKSRSVLASEQVVLEQYSKSRDALAQQMSREELAEARRMVAAWRPRKPSGQDQQK